MTNEGIQTDQEDMYAKIREFGSKWFESHIPDLTPSQIFRERMRV